MAGTGLDEHHFFLHQLAIRALEFHRESGCSVRGTATAISTHTTELGPVGLHAGTAGQFKLDRLGNFGGSDALFAFFNCFLQVSFARSDHAKSALLFKSALGIVIGDSGRDAHPTSLGASTPFSCLDQAVSTD